MLGVPHILGRGIKHKGSGYRTPEVRGITHDFEIKFHINQSVVIDVHMQENAVNYFNLFNLQPEHAPYLFY